MLNKSIFYGIHPDAPKDMRSFGDRFVGNEKSFGSAGSYSSFSVGFESAAVPHVPGLQNPSLVSSYKGEINRILFAFPSIPQSGTSDRIEAYKSLIAALRVGTSFIVVHYASEKGTIEQWFSQSGHDIGNIDWVELPEYVNFTDWAEDAYVALVDSLDGSSYLMEPWEFPRSGDSLIADAVEEYSDLKASQAPLIFQGGNCLIADDFWILGKDYYQDTIDLINKQRLPISIPPNQSVEDAVRKTFKDYVDHSRPMFVAGTKKQIPLAGYIGSKEGIDFILDIAGSGVGLYQPIFHVDMFISLIGKNSSGDFEVMIGSPSLGNQLIGLPDRPLNLQSAYDEIAKAFEDNGVKVHRNPLVHFPEFTGRTISIGKLRTLAAANPNDRDINSAVKDFNNLNAADTDIAKIRSWHHITCNNCLVESSEKNGKNAYLPTFGHGNYQSLSALDNHMKTMWEGFGYTVHQLGDFNSFAKRQGVVHCISKYISRGA